MHLFMVNMLFTVRRAAGNVITDPVKYKLIFKHSHGEICTIYEDNTTIPGVTSGDASTMVTVMGVNDTHDVKKRGHTTWVASFPSFGFN